MNSTYKLALIFLGSALLAQPPVQASEKMPDIRSTVACVVVYCPNIHCWQKEPCLVEHEKNERAASTNSAKLWNRERRLLITAISLWPDPKDGMQRRLSNPRCWAPIVCSPTS